MTAFVPSELPSEINTVERLFLWCALALKTCNPTIGVLEAQDVTQQVVQGGHFDAADGTRRYLSRVSLELDPAYDYDASVAMWMRAREISNTALPTGYKN